MNLHGILAGFCFLGTVLGVGAPPADHDEPLAAVSGQTAELDHALPPRAVPGAADGPEGRQGGETCLDAVLIDEIPYSVLGTTADFNDDYEEVCPYPGSTSPDVVYSYQPTYDRKVHISLCHPGTTYDSKLYVYENACVSPPIACNDDDCAGGRSRLLDVELTAGNVYYIVIDGFAGDAGSYELTIEKGTPPPPECPPDSPFSQPSNGAGSAGISEQGATCVRFENYDVGADGGVENLRCWGVAAGPNADWIECLEDPPAFVLKFFPDNSGVPGGLVCEQALQPSVTDTELLYSGYKIYQYDFVLDPVCPLSAGWVSVQGAGDPDCWFFWMSCPESVQGDNYSLKDVGSGYLTQNYDLSLCVNGDPRPPVCPGDLNCDGFIDFGDINPFVLALSNWPAWLAQYPDCREENADVNSDGQYGGQYGFGDINPFVSLLASGQGQPIPCE